MIHKKLFMAFIMASLLCAGAPAFSQSGQPPQKTIDPAKLAEAIKNCPGLQGVDAKALAASAQNCPGLNGTVQGTNCPDLTAAVIDPVLLAAAAKNCPALNPNLPAEAAKCPALNGTPGALKNCPAFAAGGFSGPVSDQSSIDKKIDKRMTRIVRALERNKKSAEVLVQAARDAGADPNQIKELQEMSQAFRQVFMNMVSPQQIIESILSANQQPAPVSPDVPQGIIITGPDGSTWIVAPAEPSAQGAAPQTAPGQTPPPGFLPPQGLPPQGPPLGFVPPPAVPPQGMPPAFIPPQGLPQQGMPPAVSKPVKPAPQQGRPSAIGRPPQAGQPPVIATPGQNQPQVQGEMIIMEEVPQYMPLWPTKDDLGKDGVLQYLEKRNRRINSN